MLDRSSLPSSVTHRVHEIIDDQKNLMVSTVLEGILCQLACLRIICVIEDHCTLRKIFDDVSLITLEISLKI